MGDVIIRDPSSGQGADVTDKHLAVIAVIESEFEHISEDDSLAFSWSIVAADFAAAETMLIVQNTSPTLKLHIEDVSFSVDNASEVDIHIISGATTPSGGTAVVGRCLNVSAPKVAEAAAHADDTANSAQGNIIWANRILASTPILVPFGGSIILGNTDAIAVDVTTAPTSLANCNITGFYKET